MSVNLRVYKLRFKEPVHLGEQGVGLEEVTSFVCHSDTLWSAIVDIWVKMKGEAGTLSEFWNGADPPFLLTSAFPFVDDVLYFPRPLLPIGDILQGVDDVYITKEIKKTAFWPQDVFFSWIQNGNLNAKQLERAVDAAKVLKENIAETVRPRVAIGHAAFRSQIYYTARTYYSEKAGLWFAVDFRRKDIVHDFEAVLELLGDTGLGGLRSIGHGAFSVEKMDVEFPMASNSSSRYILLSLLIPTDSNLFKGSYYAIVERKGWALSSSTKEQGRRKILRMLKEGSVLTVPDEGKVVDVTPEGWPSNLHKVYRYGMGFYFPIQETAK